jgi:hypothetical protein
MSNHNERETMNTTASFETGSEFRAQWHSTTGTSYYSEIFTTLEEAISFASGKNSNIAVRKPGKKNFVGIPFASWN